MSRFWRLSFWFVVVHLTLGPVISADAAEPAAALEHRGIHFSAMPLPEKRGDIVLLEPAAGVESLRKALDLIHKASPFSVKHLKTLKRNGRVSVVYDAKFPKKQLSSVTIAAFYPDFFQKEAGGPKQFLVVVGRFGIKWPTDKLAAVIVHELVGHGLQHYRGHGEKDRKIDLECEALIYEEKSHQDLKLKRDTDDMVRFRRDVRSNWCADFSRYLRGRKINVDKAWGFGRPDVPKLLAHFDAYRKHLRKTGQSGKAVAAAKAKRAEGFTALIAEAKATGSAKKMLRVGQRYLKGIGAPRDARKGAEWVAKSAKLGHGPAQYIFGALLAAGHGVRKDRIEAYKWFSMAKANGVGASHKYLKRLRGELTAAQVSEAERRAAAAQ